MYEVIEQACRIMGSWTGLRVALKTEHRLVGIMQTLQSAVEQGAMGHAHIGWQAGLIHRETMILAGDHHPIGGYIQYRVIGAVMAEFHLYGTCPTGQAQQLMTQANTEHRQASGDDLAARRQKFSASWKPELLRG